jgi:uncharacterized phosphosugar-binding protein
MPIDVEKLAREAGASVVGDTDPQCWSGSIAFDGADLSRFAALVLEAAAVQCEDMAFVAAGKERMNTAADCDRCADAIRAMKPGESNE